MNEKLKNDLFYLCSLIEFIGRITKNHRGKIVEVLGKDELKRQLSLAEVNHTLSFEQVSDELIDEFQIQIGNFDTVSECLYSVPSFLAIGKEYQRLIFAVQETNENIIDTLFNVFTSFISDEISNFNSSVYYSNPDYLKWSYFEGELIA